MPKCTVQSVVDVTQQSFVSQRDIRNSQLQTAGSAARQDDQYGKSAYDMAVHLGLRKKSIFAS